MVTTKARKQRKRLFTAPGHLRTRSLSAHVDEALRDKNEWLPRAVPVRKGDQVKVMRGDFYGITGKVSAVDHRSRTVTVEDIVLEKMDKKKVARPLPTSNLVIMAFDESDPRRRERLARPQEEKA
jgi:large subunit ribosomal protein L24